MLLLLITRYERVRDFGRKTRIHVRESQILEEGDIRHVYTHMYRDDMETDNIERGGGNKTSSKIDSRNENERRVSFFYS